MKVRAIVLAAALVLSVTPFALSQNGSNPPSSSTTPAANSPQPAQTPAQTQAPTSQPSQANGADAQQQPGPDSAAAPATDTSTPPPPAQPTAAERQTKEKVKPGSRDDVDAIGNRDVGKGGGLGNWYSLEKEIRMGKEVAQQVEASVKLVQDPVVNEYVNRIGQNLVRNSDARVPF